MTSSSDGLTAPFALVRFRAGDAEPVLGLVAGDRVREIGPDELGAPDLNAFLAEAPAVVGSPAPPSPSRRMPRGSRSPTSR